MIDIVEIKPHTAEGKIINNNVLSIFLAGTIDMGDSEDWQHNVKLRFEEFAKKNKDKVTKESSIHLYNPRRLESWGNDKDEMEYQVNWELDHLEKANIILMNLLPNSKSPISLLELGLFARSKKLFIICPPEFYRYDNVRIMAERYKIKLYNNIDEFFNKEMQW